MVYLGQMLAQDGHEVRYLSCRGALGACYNLMIKGKKSLTCTKCRLGGFGSFADTKGKVAHIDDYIDSAYEKASPSEAGESHEMKLSMRLKQWSQSSSYTLTRIEDLADCNSGEVLKFQDELLPGVLKAYNGTLNFLDRFKPDAALVFNGRMDVLRAAYEACKDRAVRTLCVERTWFGQGVQLNSEGNCLSLRELHEASAYFAKKPLTVEQASAAAARIVSRFTGSNSSEWRQYNKERDNSFDYLSAWPEGGRKKILILPSSKNEQLSHPDWSSEIDDYLNAFKLVMSKFSSQDYSMLLRGHPNWAENIGVATGEKIEQYYQRWCRENSVSMIASSKRCDTSRLIQLADIVILNGSSAAYEAGLLGKKVICLGKSHYSFAGISKNFYSLSEIEDFDPSTWTWDKEEVVRRTLRFVYCFAYRFAYFQKYIQPISTTKYRYSKNFDVNRLNEMLEFGVLGYDDSETAEDLSGETQVVERLMAGCYEDLIEGKANGKFGLRHGDIFAEHQVARRPLFSMIARLRDYLPRGDR